MIKYLINYYNLQILFKCQVKYNNLILHIYRHHKLN